MRYQVMRISDTWLTSTTVTVKMLIVIRGSGDRMLSTVKLGLSMPTDLQYGEWRLQDIEKILELGEIAGNGGF